MPYATKSDNLCTVDGKVYISDYQRPGILEYTPETDTWEDLPTPTRAHGMVSHNGKLTLVGGLTNESSYSSKIRVWDSDSKQWTEPYPPMTSEQIKMECASYLHYLIIAGGKKTAFEITRSVEILDTKSGLWFEVPTLLYNTRRYITSMTMIGESLCASFTHPDPFKRIMGTKDQLWKVSLPTLISHILQGKDHDTSIWEKIPERIGMIKCRTVFSIGNMLLTVGGYSEGFFAPRPYADIYLFNPHTNEWVKIGELPEPRYSCACTLLPSGKLLVAGGQGDYNSLLPTVYTATISGSYFEPVHF